MSHIRFVALCYLSHYYVCRIITYVCRQLWRLSLVGLVAASWMIWLFRFIFGGGPCMLFAHCVSLFPKFYTVLNSSSFPKIQYTTECRWDKVTWSGTACAFFPQYILDSVVFSKWAPKYTTEQFTVQSCSDIRLANHVFTSIYQLSPFQVMILPGSEPMTLALEHPTLSTRPLRNMIQLYSSPLNVHTHTHTQATSYLPFTPHYCILQKY